MQLLSCWWNISPWSPGLPRKMFWSPRGLHATKPNPWGVYILAFWPTVTAEPSLWGISDEEPDMWVEEASRWFWIPLPQPLNHRCHSCLPSGVSRLGGAEISHSCCFLFEFHRQHEHKMEIAWGGVFSSDDCTKVQVFHNTRCTVTIGWVKKWLMVIWSLILFGGHIWESGELLLLSDMVLSWALLTVTGSRWEGKGQVWGCVGFRLWWHPVGRRVSGQPGLAGSSRVYAPGTRSRLRPLYLTTENWLW